MYGVVDFLVNLLNYFMCSLLHAMHFLLVAAVKRANQGSVEQTAHNCVCRKNDSTETEASSSSSSLFYSLADRIRSTQFCVVTNTHNPMKTGHRRINTKPTLLVSETNVGRGEWIVDQYSCCVGICSTRVVHTLTFQFHFMNFLFEHIF